MTAADTGDEGRGQLILLILLGTATLGFGLAAHPWAGRMGARVDRFRLELAGVSVACALVLLMVVAGVV